MRAGQRKVDDGHDDEVSVNPDLDRLVKAIEDLSHRGYFPAIDDLVSDSKLTGVPTRVYLHLLRKLDPQEFRHVKNWGVAKALGLRPGTVGRAMDLLVLSGFLQRGKREQGVWSYTIAYARDEKGESVDVSSRRRIAVLALLAEWHATHGDLPSAREAHAKDRAPRIPGCTAITRALGATSWRGAMLIAIAALGLNSERYGRRSTERPRAVG